MAVKTIAANPAAGPLTPILEPLKTPTIIPPTMPAMSPEKRGAPLAKAIPKHRGSATKKTTILAGTSLFIVEKIFFDMNVLFFEMKCKYKNTFENDSNTILKKCKTFVFLKSK